MGLGICTIIDVFCAAIAWDRIGLGGVYFFS